MKISYTNTFERLYRKLPENIKTATEKAIKKFSENPRHPSLRTRKIPGTDRWYFRVTDDYRITFDWEDDEVTLRVVDSHDEAFRRERR